MLPQGKSNGGANVISCVKCLNELPDGALHCVFCGAKQVAGPQAAPPAAGEDKTVMHRGRAAASAPQPQPQRPMAGPGVAGPGPAGPGPAAPIGLKTALGQLDDEDFSGAKTIGVSGDLVRQVLDNLPEPPPAAPPLAGGFGPPPAAPPR